MSLLFPNTNASTCLLVLSLRPCIQHETFQGLVILRCLEEPKYHDIRIHRQSDKLQVLSSGALATIGLRLLQSLTILFLSFVLFGSVGGLLHGAPCKCKELLELTAFPMALYGYP